MVEGWKAAGDRRDTGNLAEVILLRLRSRWILIRRGRETGPEPVGPFGAARPTYCHKAC